jgi:hypothetical protein
MPARAPDAAGRGRAGAAEGPAPDQSRREDPRRAARDSVLQVARHPAGGDRSRCSLPPARRASSSSTARPRARGRAPLELHGPLRGRDAHGDRRGARHQLHARHDPAAERRWSWASSASRGCARARTPRAWARWRWAPAWRPTSAGQPAPGAEAGSRGRAAHAAGLDQRRARGGRRVVVAPASERDGRASPAARRRARHLATGARRRSAAGHAAAPEAPAAATAHPAQGR